MTIITTSEELEKMMQEAELDIGMWNTHSLQEVYEHFSATDTKKEYV